MRMLAKFLGIELEEEEVKEEGNLVSDSENSANITRVEEQKITKNEDTHDAERKRQEALGDEGFVEDTAGGAKKNKKKSKGVYALLSFWNTVHD